MQSFCTLQNGNAMEQKCYVRSLYSCLNLMVKSHSNVTLAAAATSLTQQVPFHLIFGIFYFYLILMQTHPLNNLRIFKLDNLTSAQVYIL